MPTEEEVLVTDPRRDSGRDEAGEDLVNRQAKGDGSPVGRVVFVSFFVYKDCPGGLPLRRNLLVREADVEDPGQGLSLRVDVRRSAPGEEFSNLRMRLTTSSGEKGSVEGGRGAGWVRESRLASKWRGRLTREK